jgi:subtilisin family serine protease
MSLGGIPSFALHRAIRRAVAADIIVLAAAGNCVRTVVWPARYDDCIAVGGTNAADQPWRGSCQGPAVDISAPGENVYRARVAGDGRPVGQGQGTSFAVALTAGVAALWLAHHGRANLVAAARARGETLQEMFRRLVRATARRPLRWDSFRMGAGIVDARALLEADLDLDRAIESAPQPDDAAVRAAVAVQSLVLEQGGADAFKQALDWNRYGAEVAHAILRARLLAPEPDAPSEEAAPEIRVSISESLSQQLSGSPLEALLAMAPGVRE